MSGLVKTTYPFLFEEDQLALNLYARVFKKDKFDSASSFKIIDSSKTTPPTAAFVTPLDATKSAVVANFNKNLGMYSMQMADNDAFFVRKFDFDLAATGYTPADLGMDQSKMSNLLTKGVFTASELLWAFKYAKGNNGADSAAKGTAALGKVAGLNGKIGRESLAKVVDDAQKLYGDYHYKKAFAIRPTRTTYPYDATIKGLADANVAAAGSPAKKQFADIARFTWAGAFSDSLTTTAGHVNLNFQGSEDFAYVLKEAKARMTTANKTGDVLKTYIDKVLNEIEKRDFEWWNTWSDSTKVAGNFEINKRGSTDGVNKDIGDYFEMYSVVDYLGAQGDKTIVGREWILRMISAAKRLGSTKYSFTPAITNMVDAELKALSLTLDGKDSTGAVKTLKQQLGLYVLSKWTALYTPLVFTTRKTDFSDAAKLAALPAINYDEVEMFGFDEPRYIFKSGWGSNDYKKQIANFEKRILLTTQTIGPRVKTATGSMPTDSELSAVSTEFGKDS